MSTNSDKNPVGKPSKYTSEICETIETIMSEGLSKMELSLALNISRDTLYRWIEKYPEFKHAVAKGMERSKAWHIKQLRRGMMGEIKKFNVGAATLLMRNMFDWNGADKQGQTNISIENIQVLQQIPKLSDEELNKRIEVLEGNTIDAEVIDED